MNTQTAILGGGCFWCLEAVFQRVKGVQQVTSGYAGGARANPSYEQICTGATGHAEVVKIDFDAEVISLEQLLTIFFAFKANPQSKVCPVPPGTPGPSGHGGNLHRWLAFPEPKNPPARRGRYMLRQRGAARGPGSA